MPARKVTLWRNRKRYKIRVLDLETHETKTFSWDGSIPKIKIPDDWKLWNFARGGENVRKLAYFIFNALEKLS